VQFAPLRPPARANSGPAPVASRAPGPGPVAAGQQSARIRVTVTSDPADQREMLVTRFPCVIGRDPAADFSIEGDKSLSRNHAQVAVQGGRLVITDLNSVNGTAVAGSKLPTGGTVALGRRNTVRLGRNTELEIET
jgi:predicted component of type VI protein secretion system